jgi:hypothetical protein
MTDAMSLQVRRDPIDEDHILDVFQRMYEQFEKDRALIPAGNFHEVRYEDLVADPLTEMQRIYGQLRLGDFTAIQPALEEYLTSIKDYQPNRHEVSDELMQKIRSRCQSYSEKYGYQ